MLRTLACLIALAAPAAALEPSRIVRGEILPGWSEGGHRVAGLRLSLAPGWKTYWRAPGDAGIPPVFDWSGSVNVSAVDVRFPVPEVFDQQGFRSIGYTDEVVLPLIVRRTDATAPVALAARIELGVCREVCIPVSLSVAGPLGGDDRAPALAAALADRPVQGGRMTCRVMPGEDGLRVEIETERPARGDLVAVIEPGDPALWVSEPRIADIASGLRVTAEIVAPTSAPFALARDDLRLTYIADGAAFEHLGCD